MIDPENTFGMLAAIFGIIVLGFLSERTWIGRRLTGAVVVLLLAAVFANIGVLPNASPVYGAIWSIGVPLAVALYLMKADLFSIVREGGRTLIAFLAGTFGVLIGAMLGALLFDLGPNEAPLAGVFAATYSGGSLNFAAVAEAIKFTDASLLAAAVAVDNVLGIAFYAALSGLAGWAGFKKLLHWRASALETDKSLDSEQSKRVDTADGEGPALRASDLAVQISLAAAVCALGGIAATALDATSYRILFISIFAVVFATLGAKFLKSTMANVTGASEIATLIMYAFFVMLGASAVLSEMSSAPAALVPFVLVIFGCHGIATIVAARIFRLNFGEVIVASAACIGGPPIAIAYAVLFGWRSLAGPAIATGVFGYAIGNFVGLGVFEVASIMNAY